MATRTIQYDTGVSGSISRASGIYTVSVGTFTIIKLEGAPPTQWQKVFLHFDVSWFGANGIDNSMITKVELFRVDAVAQGVPVSTDNLTNAGEWLGSSLDGTQADFAGGDNIDVSIISSSYSDDSYIDLSDGGEDLTSDYYFNVNGFFDLSFSVLTPIPSSFIFNKAKSKMNLRVTYTPPAPSIPPLRTLLGVGL